MNDNKTDQAPHTEDAERMRRELALTYAINQQLDPLVRLASTRVCTLTKETELEESQVRNVLNVAQESRSIEVVVNFIRYQIGRKGSTWGKQAHDIGHGVIRDIQEQVSTLADHVVAHLREQQIHNPEELRGEAYERLMLLYLGYLNRTFYYGKKAESFYTNGVKDGFADLKALFAQPAGQKGAGHDD
jgi:hypothetical protein